MMESAVVANALQATTSVEEDLTLVCIQAEQEDCFSHIMVPNLKLFYCTILTFCYKNFLILVMKDRNFMNQIDLLLSFISKISMPFLVLLCGVCMSFRTNARQFYECLDEVYCPPFLQEVEFKGRLSRCHLLYVKTFFLMAFFIHTSMK